MAFLNRNIDPTGIFDSPLNQGRVDKGYDNLEVRLLYKPQIDALQKLATISDFAVSGGKVNPVKWLDGELDDTEVQEAAGQFNAGILGQDFESQTVGFLVYGCSRAYTHESVRTRGGASYTQQTFRHSNMGNANLRMSHKISQAPDNQKEFWIDSNTRQIRKYVYAVEELKWDYQDARDLLPIATETWIIEKFPLSTWLGRYAYRACTMFLPQMVWITRKQGELLGNACPELKKYIKISCEIPTWGPGSLINHTSGDVSTIAKTNHCHFGGTEKVEDVCDFPWAKESLRLNIPSRFYGK